MPKPVSIAIDIGGTKTSFGFVTEGGEILFKDIVPTGDSPDPQDLISRLAEKIIKNFSKFETNYSVSGVGIGVPNGNYFKGTVEYAPNLRWKGIVPLARFFSEKLPFDVVLTNDANAAALGEMYFGGARGMRDFIFITLGTGLGSGIVANGELIYGHSGFAGEMGHTIIIQHGRLCGCGRRGCLEQYCSATGIVKTYFEILKNSGQTDRINDDIDSKYVFDKALGGEEAAFYAFNYTGEMLGLALANSAAYLNPEAIFLFGGLASAGELLFNPVNISFEKNLLNVYKGKTKILPSGLPENNAALLGASSLVWNELKKKK